MKRTAFSPHDDIYIQHLENKEKHNMSVQHYHDMYEIYLHLEGKRYIFYDNICYTLERGDLAIFKPFDIHYAESREFDYYERYVLNFRDEKLSKILSSEEKYILFEKINSCVVRLNEEQTQILYEYFKMVDKFFDKKGFFKEKLICSALFQLLVYVTECIDGEQIIQGESVSPQIISAIKYINENYAQRLSLEEIAKAACISKYYFSHKFKEVTGATVLEYLNNVRLTKVHNLLIKTEYTTEEISRATGFSSSAHLIRVFKEVYGISPKAFRKLRNNTI